MLPDLNDTFLLLAAGALLLERRPRGLALAGVVAAGLAVAAFAVRLGDGPIAGLALRAAERGAPLGFLRLNTGLLLLGVLLPVGVGLMAIRRGRSVATLLGAGGIVVTGVLTIVGLRPLMDYVGWLPTAGAAIGLGASAATLGLAARVLRITEGIRRLDGGLLERRPSPLLPALSYPFDLSWFSGLLIAVVVVGVAPSLRAVALAIVVAATVSHVLMRRLGGGTAIPVLPLLGLLMVPAVVSFTSIGGASNSSLSDLANGPFSVAAEIRIVPWIALVAWGFAGLWPIHGVVNNLSAPLAGVVLIRLGANVLPSGLEHWVPLFMPVVLLGLWHAATTIGPPENRTRRTVSMLTATALFGILAGHEAITGAGWLLAAAAAFPWMHSASAYLPDLPLGLGRLLWLPVAGGGLQVLIGGLQSQITYTVLTAAAVAWACWSAER